MNDLEQSYTLCQRLARRAASNFYFSFLLLPRDKRRGMAALYAFLRQVDDLADDESCDMVSRKQALETLRADLHAALAGQARQPVLLALADTVARFGIPEEYLTAVIDGVEMDLDHKLFETFEDLETYCYRVASVVGLACIHIWGFRGSQALEPARQCGLAFQLTNILRDLKEDAARNRVYLPQEDLRRFGYSIEQLKHCTVNKEFDELMQFEVVRAERFYQTAEQLEFQLDRDGRRVLSGHDDHVSNAAGENKTPASRGVFAAYPAQRLGKTAHRSRCGFQACFHDARPTAVRDGVVMSGPSDAAPRVAIIGGGLAGLAAAVALADRGLHIELFEARRQLGGRTAAFRDPATGELVDHCQHVTLGCCTNFDDFCRRTGLSEFLRRDRTLHFIGPDGRRYDLAASRVLPAPLHLLPSLLRLKYLSWHDRLGIIRALRQLARWPANDDPAGLTIDQWLRQHRQSENAIELFWTPVIVSALSETLDRVAVPPVRKVFVDAFLGHRQAYEMSVPTVPLAKFYGQRLEQWLAQHGVILRAECPVKQMLGDRGGIKELETGDGQRATFDMFVLAAPWRRVEELLSIELGAALPELQAAAQFESASITAVHLWFDRAITELPHAVLPGRMSQWVFNRGVFHFEAADQPPGHHYQVVISASNSLAQQSRDDIVEMVIRDLNSVWPAAGAKLLQARVITEQHAVFSPRPGAERLRPPQRTGVPNLFLAGDWTATGWPATMEGAVRSGYLAAEGVLSQLGRPARSLVPDAPRPWLTRWLMGAVGSKR